MSQGLRFLQQGKRLLSCAGLLLLLYAAIRIFFLVYNYALFPTLGFREGYNIGWLGIQQDFESLLLLNSPVLLLIMTADLLQTRKQGKGRNILYRIAKGLFLLLNTIGLVLNFIDIGYFRYSKHRSNLDLLFVIRDSLGSFKSILTGYWPLLLGFLIACRILALISRRIHTRSDTGLQTSSTTLPFADRPSPENRLFLWQVLLNQAIFAGLLLLPCGILTGKPVLPANPLLFLSPSDLPVAQNSLLTFAYSLLRRHRELEWKQYFTREELARIVQTNHMLGAAPNTMAWPAPDSGKAKDPMLRKNVVICILESFSRCYVIPGDPQKANTPFFDSLIRKSLFFPNSFANGFASNQGIVSILGGLPGLLEEPFYYSDYANTPLHSLGNILQSKGYETDFFMGAGRDHFGFGKFAHMAGIDHYYSRDDFNKDQPEGDRYYDGNWGIFDEPFLQFGARMLSKKQQPFLAVFFTISAHPPYTLPAALRDEFSLPDKTPAQRSISYTDYSFRKFFESCRKMSWFSNTLFVFCADHWLYPDDHTGYTYVNSSTIPLFIYDPSNDAGSVRKTLASQVDLTPTVLDMLRYRGGYTGFGRSLLDSSIADSDRYAINRFVESYQVISDEFVLGYDPAHDSSRYMFRYKTDPLLKDNLIAAPDYARERRKLDTLIRANIQAYNQALRNRSLE